MPTIYQLPNATAVSSSDVLPISQNGQTRNVTVGTLLSGTQSVITITQGDILGRSSAGSGGPEPIKLSNGIALQSGALIATAQDHTSLVQASVLQPTDEIIINSAAVPKRVGASSIRGLFSGGSGVTIDQSGVISVTGGVGGSGVPGPQGPVGPAGQGLNFRGAWQQNTTYAAYDVLVYAGQTYFVTAAFTSGTSFDASRLTLMASSGAAGATGSQGPQGPQGPAGPIVAATPTALGAVKPGAGLVISSDGTISIGSVALATIAQGGAKTGQVLGWTGTGWSPTAGASAGVQTFNTRTGAITLSLQDITAVTGTGATARANLALAAVASSGAYSDLTGAPTIPSASSSLPTAPGTATAGTAQTFARGDHAHPTDTSRLAVASNLADLASTSAARANLGLGNAATLNVGTVAGTVAAGNDSRLASALQPTAIPAASGALLGSSSTAGQSVTVTVGSGLTLTNGVLTAVSSGSVLSPATTTVLGGIKPDGTTLSAAADGTLSVIGVSLGSLPDISTAGGVALTDVSMIDRGGSDYKLSLSAQAALFRKTPAGSRTVTLSASSPSATLTANDHDKIVVVTGSLAGQLTTDGSLSDGFRCQVINHTGSGLTFAGITGLQGLSSLPDSASCLVTLSNGKLEASGPTTGGSSATYTLPIATNSVLGGVKPDASTITAAADGTISVSGISASALPDISTAGGPALSDIAVLSRGTADYKSSLSSSVALFRRTPAGSRTIILTATNTVATVTSTDHDKVLVVSGSGPGSLTTDGSLIDGFRCQLINHSGAALTLSGITGLQGITSIPNNAFCWITLSNAMLEASSPVSSATVSPATTTTIGAVKPDGTTLSVAADGTLAVVGTALASMADISTIGGPALTDIDLINRSGVDYKATLAERQALFRKTPAGSRTIALASGATTATLLPADNDKVVVLTGIASGALTTDATIADGFRCQVINHTTGPVSFASPLSGLNGATTLAQNALCWVTLSNGSVEASIAQAAPAGSSGQLQINSGGSFGAVTLGSGLTLSGGTLSVSTGTTYTLPAATTSNLGGVKAGSGISVGADGTVSVPAYFNFGVSGTVAALPGGGGAVVYRYVFVRPCSLATNLANPFAAQGQSGTASTANATFTLSKISGGASTAFGAITVQSGGTLSVSSTQTAFAPGDELVVTAPNPADASLADVSISFTGMWG